MNIIEKIKQYITDNVFKREIVKKRPNTLSTREYLHFF
ncbi:Uncharacterized protein AMR50_2923 [Leptospira interrogans]|nr:Uncharacterized protein AMR50_2923 [Leptospira interrogans]